VVRLVWAFAGQTEVFRLHVGKSRQLDVDVLQVKHGHLFVQDLGENVDTDVELALLAEFGELGTKVAVTSLVQHDLGQDLVGEGARHDERRVTSGASQVDQATVSEEDDVGTRRHQVAVHLGLDVDARLGVGLEPGNVNFHVEVTNVCRISIRLPNEPNKLTADNGIVAHGLKVLANNDVTAASGGDKDLTNGSGLFHGGDLETRHGSLKSVDGVNLGDENDSTHRVKSLSTALADITETSNDGNLSGNHDISGTLDTVDQRFTAAVQVVELGLGDRVVDVDGRDQEATLLHHLVQMVDTSGGLLRNTIAALEHVGVFLVNEGSQVTTVVEDEVKLGVILESEQLLLKAPLVLLFRLTLPGEAEYAISDALIIFKMDNLHWDTSSGNGSSSMVLCRVDVAAGPRNFSTESGEGLDEDSSLDGHVQATGDTGALERLFSSILLASGHETGHFIFGQFDFTTAESGQTDVGDLELVGGSRHGGW